MHSAPTVIRSSSCTVWIRIFELLAIKIDASRCSRRRRPLGRRERPGLTSRFRSRLPARDCRCSETFEPAASPDCQASHHTSTACTAAEPVLALLLQRDQLITSAAPRKKESGPGRAQLPSTKWTECLTSPLSGPAGGSLQATAADLHPCEAA